jgi:hypothetical protein
LVTTSIEAYEELAVALARDPEKFAAIKAKLMRNRDTEPLFDSVRFTHHLETAFSTMWERHRAGGPPVGFSIPAAAGSAVSGPDQLAGVGTFLNSENPK